MKKSNNDWLIKVYFTKSNNLITSKSRMTIIGRKVLDAAIMNVRETYDEYGNPIIKADIDGQELKKFIGRDYNSIYDTVKSLIKPKSQKGADALKPSLLDWKVIIADDDRQQIIGINVITLAKYTNGKLSIVFNNALKQNLIGLKKNYTMLNRDIISKFSSNYSYQLYQIFKKTIDKELSRLKEDGIDNGNHPFELIFDIIDLKVQLGVIEASENDILYKAIMNNNVCTYEEVIRIDDDELVERLTESRNFRRYAVEKAKKEINEISDIKMDYKPIYGGKGGKTVGFKFFIQYKEIEKEKEEKEPDEVDIFEFIDKVREIIKEPVLSSKEIKSISDAAGYDLDKIKKAYNVYQQQDNVRNVPGFIIDAIKNDYKELPGKKKSPGLRHYLIIMYITFHRNHMSLINILGYLPKTQSIYWYIDNRPSQVYEFDHRYRFPLRGLIMSFVV